MNDLISRLREAAEMLKKGVVSPGHIAVIQEAIRALLDDDELEHAEILINDRPVQRVEISHTYDLDAGTERYRIDLTEGGYERPV